MKEALIRIFLIVFGLILGAIGHGNWEPTKSTVFSIGLLSYMAGMFYPFIVLYIEEFKAANKKEENGNA